MHNKFKICLFPDFIAYPAEGIILEYLHNLP